MIKDIFRKPIDRDIEGVIKADNQTAEAMLQEVDEYVITNELYNMFDDFFDAYSSSIGKETESVGVWISGFFGSGKSHLLKILSYILSNQQINSDAIGDLFLQKVSDDDFELKENIKKALSIPAQSILFNIDQKSDIGSKSEDDAILGVFMKVFNELRGYYPKQGYIAKFEKDLDDDDLFDSFKEKFQALNSKNQSWEESRKKIHLIKDNITKALEEIGISSSRATIDDYKRDYKVSIEDFANEVKEYIDKQPQGFRLIFCVDEIGQYIGDNTKLMLNLQTIVETLATKCQGSAWIMVTSQSAVSDLVSSNEKMENDFSKILGRFKIKLNLTSANATEVIKKRLLDKKEEVKPELESLYEKKKNALQSIIHFSDRSRQYKTFKESIDFIDIYPFIPYQMELFQSCILGLSNNSSFQGKHQSVGERSMLNVVQNVATKNISTKEIGSLATFDAFYDGLASTIRPELQTQIKQTKELLSPFHQKVLKVLFMVKYVKEFSANIENITTLLVDSLDVNISELKTDTKEALNLLTDQTYIQKVGDNYAFLTDVEKDIENEIKMTEIEDRELSKKLSDWIFDDIIKITKVRFEGNKQDYPFTRKMDDTIVKGREEELLLNIITPLNSETYDESRLIHKSLADRDVIIALPDSREFERDLALFVKTNKYVMHKRGNTTTTQEDLIIQAKSHDNNSIRNKKLQNDLRDLFSEARVYFNGKILDITTKDTKLIVESAFNEAINTIYPNLSMLRKIYSENDIKEILLQSDDLFADGIDTLNEAELDMLTYLQRQKKSYQNVTLTKLLENYTTKPYGWYQNAVLCTIAMLFARKKIDFKQNSVGLDKSEALSSLTNSRLFSTTIVSLALEIDDSKIKSVKKRVIELFPDGEFHSISPKDIYTETMQQNDTLTKEIEDYTNLDYPFVSTFSQVIEPFKKLKDLSYEEFFDNFSTLEDELFDAKEDLITPILEFMSGEKRKIYNSVKTFIKDNSENLKYIKDEKIVQLEELLELDKPYLGNKIQLAKNSLNHIQGLLDPLIKESQTKAVSKLDDVIKNLQQSDNFELVPDADRYKVIRPIQDIQNRVKNSTSIDYINLAVSSDKLKELVSSGLETIDRYLPSEIIKSRVDLSKLIPKTKTILKSSKDLEEFILQLKENLQKQIDEDKEIII